MTRLIPPGAPGYVHEFPPAPTWGVLPDGRTALRWEGTPLAAVPTDGRRNARRFEVIDTDTGESHGTMSRSNAAFQCGEDVLRRRTLALLAELRGTPIQLDPGTAPSKGSTPDGTATATEP